MSDTDPGTGGTPGEPSGFGRPSGPSFGGPASHDQGGAGAHPFQDQPWTARPPRPYGPPAGQQPQAQPTRPYPQPYPNPGAPDQRASNTTKIILLVGAGALVLVLVAVVGGVLLFGHRNVVADPTGPGSPATAGNQTAAVQGFLEALAAGDAKKAIGYAANTPADTTFLTDTVLEASIAKAPITQIQVAPVTSKYTSTVTASYHLGNSLVTGRFSVQQFGDQWKVEEVANDVRLSSSYAGLPLLIGGVRAKTQTVYLFPGSYEISTGSSYVSWGASPLVVKDPESYMTMSGLQPALTTAGVAAFRAAVKASGEACAKEHKAQTSCGPAIDPPSGATVSTSTITWSVSYGSFGKVTPRLDYENGRQATGYVSVGMRAKYVAVYHGRKSLYSSRSTAFVDKPRVDLFTDPLTVTWED